MLLVDDHPLMREMVADTLRNVGYAVFEAGDGERAVEMASWLQPALVIMEVVMPGMSGIMATERIVTRDPSVRVVMLSRVGSAETVHAAVQAGATGFLTKTAASRASLLDALSRASVGENVFAPADLWSAASHDSAPRRVSQLTAREREILTLAARGTTSPAVAAALGLSARTVDNHLARIYKKLGINNRTQLAHVAVGPLVQDADQETDKPTSAAVHDWLPGRKDELALIYQYLGDLSRGAGNVVLIEGEPGIGKTTLVRTATANLPEACRIFWGAGDELGQELPLLPFLDALEVRRPSSSARRTAIAGLLRGEVATDRGADVPAILADQLVALTIDETAARPVVLVIDDLQWADSASVKLWSRLARTAQQVPLFLVGITRPVPQRDDLLALRRTVDDDSRVQLSALSQVAVAELVSVLAGGQPDTGLLRLAAGAAGNPLFLTELFAALARSGGITVTRSGTAQLAAGSAPDSLPGAIADRLEFISSPTRQILRAAALLGVEFAVTDLTTVLGRNVADLVPALGEAHASGVLTEAGDSAGLAFRHPLIREALYAELPVAVRNAWHRDAGQALAEAGAAPDRVARQLIRAIAQPTGIARRPDLLSRSQAGAGHDADTEASFPAGRPAVEIERPPTGPGAPRPTGPVDEWMLGWLSKSADSLVAHAPGVAAELLAQAVDSVAAGSSRYGWLASKLADALYRTGNATDAEQVATRGLAHTTDLDPLVDLHWTLAQCRLISGRAAESLATVKDALGSPQLSAKHRARLLVLAARTQLYLGDLREAKKDAERALASAKEVKDTWGEGWALHVLAFVAIIRGDLRYGSVLCEWALSVAEKDPALTDLRLVLQVNKSVTLFNRHRCAEALVTAERAKQLADQVGAAIRVAQSHSIFGQVLYEMGRWDDALTEIASVPEHLKDAQVACCDLAVAAEIGFHRNELAAARRQLAAAEDHARRPGHRTVEALVLAQSLNHEQRGRFDEALAVLTTALDLTDDDLGETENLFADAVRLALKTGDEAAARALTERAVVLAAGTDMRHRQANALFCQGMAQRDAPVLLAVAQDYSDAGLPLLKAKALEAAADCLLKAEDRTGARQAFEQAVEAYEFLGAEADLNRINAEFRASGIRRGLHSKRRRPASGWESLTETELKVASFVEEGLSNPEIAARLMLSRRTVATHVSHILKKLNVTTRTDIAQESARQAVAVRPG